MVALLPSQRAVDHYDCSDLKSVLVNVLDAQPFLDPQLHFLSLVVHLPARQGHGVGEDGTVFVDGNVVGHFLEGQPVLGLVLSDHDEHYFVLPGHELLKGSDVEDDLIGRNGHVEGKQLIEFVGFGLLALGDVVCNQYVGYVVAGHSVESL